LFVLSSLMSVFLKFQLFILILKCTCMIPFLFIVKFTTLLPVSVHSFSYECFDWQIFSLILFNFLSLFEQFSFPFWTPYLYPWPLSKCILFTCSAFIHCLVYFHQSLAKENL
jgi:hypothetical protein